MLRPAYLFSSAILAFVVAMQLQTTAQTPDRTSRLERTDTPSVQKLMIPAQTISSQAMGTPTQPQRWVF